MFPFTLQQLRILKAIATEKNLTKAADVLYLSQPSLSKQIKTLEKNLNGALIDRENNKISTFYAFKTHKLHLCTLGIIK